MIINHSYKVSSVVHNILFCQDLVLVKTTALSFFWNYIHACLISKFYQMCVCVCAV